MKSGLQKNNHSRNFWGEGGKSDLENSRFDWVFLNVCLPKHYPVIFEPLVTVLPQPPIGLKGLNDKYRCDFMWEEGFILISGLRSIMENI